MTENWKQFQGQMVDGTFLLSEYLGGSDISGVFLTAMPETPKLAIKLVDADPVTDAACLARWKFSETLSHPHLLRIVRSGRCELNGVEVLYVAMEYAEESLAQILPQRPLTQEEAREMLPSVLDALDYLHGNGLVHGSLWPGNIMAAGDQLKLSSDSILKIGHPSKVLTAYDAPEIVHGASSASDVWSLGVTLVEVLTQRRPEWTSGTSALQLPENMAQPFRAMAERCLVRDPASRCTTKDIREQLNKPSPAAASMAVAPKNAEQKPPSVHAAAPMVAKAASGKGGWPKKFGMPVGVLAAIFAVVIVIPYLSKRESGVPRAAPTKPVEEVVPKSAVEAPKSEDVESRAANSEAASKPGVTSPVKPPENPVAAKETAAVAQPSRSLTGSSRDGIVNQVMPDVPSKAMRTINGKFRVQVRVKVDQAGNVVKSEFTSAGPSRYFANLTIDAARQWKFAPSDTTTRAWNLQFEFRRSGATVVPVQLDR